MSTRFTLGYGDWPNQMVGEEDPEESYLITKNGVFKLPLDYTRVDELQDLESNTDHLPAALLNRIGELSSSGVARDRLIIDNTVKPPEIRQIPNTDGQFSNIDVDRLQKKIPDCWL